MRYFRVSRAWIIQRAWPGVRSTLRVCFAKNSVIFVAEKSLAHPFNYSQHAPSPASKLEMNEYPAKIPVILLHAMIQFPDMSLI